MYGSTNSGVITGGPLRTFVIQSDRCYVVETDDDWYLGQVDVKHGAVRVRTGYQGHPKMISPDDVVDIIPADEHPHVLLAG